MAISRRTKLEGTKVNGTNVIEFLGVDKNTKANYRAECKFCFQTFNVLGVFLTSGKVKSCGCYRRVTSCINIQKLNEQKKASGEKATAFIHGKSKTKMYRAYMSAKHRCQTKKGKDYPYYGGRGIKMEWNNFEEFEKDMKRSYNYHIKKYGKEDTSIDRIDPEGNYCKKNCRWATSSQQNLNRRKFKHKKK